jgi:hypothetical protein
MVEIRRLSDSKFELKIKCVLDDHGRRSICAFLEKRNLKMREEKGFTIIYQ